jgi:hypothetical protein
MPPFSLASRLLSARSSSPRSVEQRLADIVLQPLDLLADGRLGAMDPLAGARETAGIDHRNETAQKLQIEHKSG